jgi:hypothetical protein
VLRRRIECAHPLTELSIFLLEVYTIYVLFSPQNPCTHEMNSLAYQNPAIIPGRVGQKIKKFSAKLAYCYMHVVTTSPTSIMLTFDIFPPFTALFRVLYIRL